MHTPNIRLRHSLIEHHQNGIIETARGNYVVAWDSTASLPQAEHDANFALFTAAPELLDACETVIARIDATNINTPICCMEDTWALLREAISKAKGEK